MTQNIFEDKWKEIRNDVKVWWDKLDEDDLDWIDGKSDKLIDLLQEKYRYSKEFAQEQFNQRIKTL